VGGFTVEPSADFRGAYASFADRNLGLRSTALGEVMFRNTRASETFAAIASSAISLKDGLYDDNGIVGGRGAIDTLAYTTPELAPGLRASVTYVELVDGDITLAATNRSAMVYGVAYVNGPLTVMGAYKSKFDKAVASTSAASITQISKANMELAALYNLGFATVGFGYDGASTEGTTPLATTGAVIQTDKAAMGFSVTAPMGAITLGLENWKRGASSETRMGAMYALSKRTQLTAAYGTKDYPKRNNPTNVTADSQYRVSVRHQF
jgi:predicted porin